MNLQGSSFSQIQSLTNCSIVPHLFNSSAVRTSKNMPFQANQERFITRQSFLKPLITKIFTNSFSRSSRQIKDFNASILSFSNVTAPPNSWDKIIDWAVNSQTSNRSNACMSEPPTTTTDSFSIKTAGQSSLKV